MNAVYAHRRPRLNNSIFVYIYSITSLTQTRRSSHTSRISANEADAHLNDFRTVVRRAVGISSACVCVCRHSICYFREHNKKCMTCSHLNELFQCQITSMHTQIKPNSETNGKTNEQIYPCASVAYTYLGSVRKRYRIDDEKRAAKVEKSNIMKCAVRQHKRRSQRPMAATTDSVNKAKTELYLFLML